MKFLKITLRDYRGIRFTQLQPRESGVTVLEGDNEVGKSSIAEALWLIFEQHDDSTSQLVKSLRPADRDAATEIEVEVSTGPYRFTYFKRFHRGPRTELKILAPHREILAGREADNRARAILEETIDTSLWKALRSQQGVEDSLEPPAAGQHRSVMGALDTAAGPLMGGEREQSVFALAQAEYEKYFTASGREKSAGDGASLPRLRTAEGASLDEVGRIQGRMDVIEQKSQRAAELEAALRVLAGQIEDQAQARDLLSEGEQRRLAAANEVERARAELQAAESSVRELTADRDLRQRTIAAIAPRMAEVASAGEGDAESASQLEASRAAVASAQAELAAAENVRAEALVALRRAEDVVQLSARQLQADQMTERLGRLQQLEPDIERLTTWLAACKVDGRVIAELEELDRKQVGLEAKREAEAAAVEIVAADGAVIAINGQDVTLESGVARRGKVRGETTIDFPAGISVTIRAGSASREIEEQVRVVGQALQTRLAAVGVDSLQAAREVLTERTANEERRKQFSAQMRNDLRDLPSARELGEKVERERLAILEVLRDSGLEEAPRVEDAKPQRERCALASAEAEARVRSAADALAAATTSLRALEHEVDMRGARIATLREELQRTEHDLAEQRARRSDQELEDLLTAATAAQTTVRSSLAALELAYAEHADAAEALRQAELACERLAREREGLRIEEAGIRALLEDAGASGLHGQLVEAEQRLSLASEELQSFSRRAAAARLLFETLKARRDHARESYSGPLKQCLERLGRRIYNDSFAVELSEDLRIVRRSLDGITLDLAQISVGAREQLSVLTRLACAALVSNDGGAPLVLDDILGWADPTRLAALGPVLADAAGESQVLLFTCTPGRFASVLPGRFISLPSGAAEDREAGASSPVAEPSRPAARTVERPAPPAPDRPPQGSFDLFESTPAGQRRN